ncbi:hypothetical protein OAG1_01660 [Agarivorans sp. OAG1]|uniref:YrhA family protein n=1 Tax=Agarivorans sp. OAG1 TaxID=3082387 RepID=UPI002B282732|nr:hypothetical protein OAG1_01660 [Agarivorans sp. OAG1]
MQQLLEKIRSIASEWGEVLEPPATDIEVIELVGTVRSLFSIELPKEFLSFLKLVNGLEFNGLIIYGTKNSETDLNGSSLDIVEMNEVFRESLRSDELDVIIVGEDSSGILVYESSSDKFQFRDRIGIDRVDSFSSFEDMLNIEIEKVI